MSAGTKSRFVRTISTDPKHKILRILSNIIPNLRPNPHAAVVSNSTNNVSLILSSLPHSQNTNSYANIDFDSIFAEFISLNSPFLKQLRLHCHPTSKSSFNFRPEYYQENLKFVYDIVHTQLKKRGQSNTVKIIVLLLLAFLVPRSPAFRMLVFGHLYTLTKDSKIFKQPTLSPNRHSIKEKGEISDRLVANYFSNNVLECWKSKYGFQNPNLEICISIINAKFVRPYNLTTPRYPDSSEPDTTKRNRTKRDGATVGSSKRKYTKDITTSDKINEIMDNLKASRMYLLETQVYGEMEFIDHLLNEMETCIELIIPSRMTNLFSTEAREDHGKNGNTHVLDSQLQTGEESTDDVSSGCGTYGNELDDVLAIMNPNISNEIEIEFNPQHFVSEIKSQFINQVHAETQSQSQGQALVRDQDQDQNQDSFAHGGFELIYNKLREDYKELENRYLKSVNSNIGVYRKCSKRTNKTIHSNNLDYIEAKGSHEGAGDFGNSRLWDTLIKTKSRIDDIMIKCQDLGIGDIIDEYSVENTFGIAVGEDNDDDDEFEDVPMEIPKDIIDANDDLPIDQSPFTGQIDPKHTVNTHNVNFLGYPGSNISTNRKAEPGSYNLDDLVTNSINPYTSNPLYSNYDSIDKTRSQKAHPSSSSYFLNFSYQNADNNIDKDTQQLGKSTHKDKYIAPSISTRPHPPEPAHIDEHNDIHGYEPKSKNPRSSSTSEKSEPTAKKQPKKPPKKNSYQVLNKLMKTGNKRRR